MAASDFVSKLSQDVRYALRQMRRAPGFALVTVLTLALGVGAAAAVFSVMDAVLIRPLPFNHPERILVTATRAPSGYTQPFSLPDFKDLRDSMPTTLDAFAGFETGTANVQAAGGPVSLNAIRSSDNFFQVFNIAPLLGRTFVRGEDEPGRNDVAVLGYDAWQNQFGGDRGIVGQVIRMDGKPTVVLGVMPAGFRFPLSQRNTVYLPIHIERKPWAVSRGSHWLRCVVRMKPGVKQPEALADLSQQMADLARAYPDVDGGRKAGYSDLAAATLGNTAAALWALTGAVAALLLIACVNVAGLLLARAVGRERELALRTAVGASRERIVRQLMTESLLLGLLSSAVGVLIAYGMTAAMRTYLITALSRGADVHMNGAVLLGAVVCALLSAMGASLLPALGLARLDPNRILKSGGNAGTHGSRARLRSGFIVSQVALSMMLLVVAGLLLRMLQRSQATELGFDSTHLLTARLKLPAGAYTGRDTVRNFYEPLLEKLQAAPGVVSAALIDELPIQDWGSNSDVHIAGQPPYPANQEMLAEVRTVSASWFRTVGLTLEQGRLLQPALDANEATPHVVVNRAFVHKFLKADENPLMARTDSDPAAKQDIVGVVSNARQDLDQPPMAEMDSLLESVPAKFRADITTMFVVVRGTGDPRALEPVLRAAVHDTDATVPLNNVETMHEIVGDQLSFQSMESWLFGIFAATAVLLAMAGLYGLVSQEVESGTRDTGVRMALGATRGHVLLRVLQRMAVLVGAGAACGVVLTLAAHRLLQSVVSMQPGRDAPLLAGLALSMTLLALLVALVPAKRAASIEPVQALRAE